MTENNTPNTGSESEWQFQADDASVAARQLSPQSVEVLPNATAIPPQGPDGSINWTASEFIAHQKSTGWYTVLIGAAIVVAILVWLLTKDKISAVVVIVGALLLAVYGARQPRQLDYRLDQQGLTIGARHFSYHSFRSFAIMPEGAFNSIVFIPLKRFAPLTTIYYAPEDEEKIVAMLSERLPMEQRKKDVIDRLMWRIRF